MPGTIRDPRMNNLEEKYGIIQIGAVLAYYKKVDMDGADLKVEIEGTKDTVNLRYLPTGWKPQFKADRLSDSHEKRVQGRNSQAMQVTRQIRQLLQTFFGG